LENALSKTWSDRFDKGLNPFIEKFNASIEFDNTDAGWFIGSGRSGVSDRNFERWQFESGDNWFFFKN